MSVKRYHPISSILHWVMVIMLTWLVFSGRALDGLLDRGFEFDFIIQAFANHKAIGVAVFFVALLRIILRMIYAAPAHEEGFRGQVAAGVQWALYAMLLVYPLTGFAFHSATTGFKTPVKWGPIQFPDFPIGGEEFWHVAHQACFYILGAILALHIAGAMFHLLIKRDGMFRRILPV